MPDKCGVRTGEAVGCEVDNCRCDEVRDRLGCFDAIALCDIGGAVEGVADECRDVLDCIEWRQASQEEQQAYSLHAR